LLKFDGYDFMRLDTLNNLKKGNLGIKEKIFLLQIILENE